MSDHVELQSSRFSYFFTATLCLLGPFAVIAMLSIQSKDEFLKEAASHKGGGIFILMANTLGWEATCALLGLFALWGTWNAAGLFWQGFYPFPDVRASANLIEFHPSIKKSPVTYDQISRWTARMNGKNSVVIIYLNETYWSFSGLYPRKTIKLHASEAWLTPLIDYFMQHPVMREK